MNNQAQQEEHTSDDEQQLLELLRTNPDILNRYPSLLTELEIPHEAGTAVSLIERQVQVLRQKIASNEDRMREFMEIARDNERLAMSRHRLALNLLGACDLDDVISLVLAELGDELGADNAVIRLFSDDDTEIKTRPEIFIARNHDILMHFDTMMKNRIPVCGNCSKEQNAFLFGDDADEIASAAVIPLASGENLGLLGLGSTSASRFSAGMGTEFLKQLGELVSAALAMKLERLR